MAYSQWVVVKIVSENMTLKVQNAKLDYGKFYKKDNKDHTISIADINKITIASGKIDYVCSCGRSGSSTGTEGRFELFEGDTKIGEFGWDCPYWKKTNHFNWTQVEATKKTYSTNMEGGNKDSGAIGNITITCVKI
ncbi:aegerolysin family protein [Flavobacterium hercynium]|nr:aegerolysin family protein [Flavobacterium hercynium]SMP14427.1 Aegerolysin [Flavobacterium hercynium]